MNYMTAFTESMRNMSGDKGERSKKTVLVIEDSEDIISIVRFMLEREGFAVVTATDGREALRMIETGMPPDVIILDVMLPFVDGFTLLKKIRETEGWRGIPAIMLSAKSVQKDIVRGLDTGADDYITKPFDSSELLARIRRLLRDK